MNCTNKTAWYLIALLIALIGIILVPMSYFIVRIYDGVTVYCSGAENGYVEYVVGLVLGVPPMVIVSTATLVLLFIIHGRNKKSNNSTDDKDVRAFLKIS